ncbi:DUF3455 domain-containing protein [Pararobbsia silviterrae]|uniref:DUF3455 domain-containing protein n=1 Tax=Pararobbsia silviterrae TaxID=1792498 RepID=UPI001314A318|nr:DUF3455 domain-containing protein [Pararobbsia silviterrae]
MFNSAGFTRDVRAVFAISAFASALVSSPCFAEADAGLVEPTDIPPALALPGHPVLVEQALGVGVQVYTCAALKNDPTRYGWTFYAPEAALFNRDRRRIGIHYGGPTWEARDGSKLIGSVKAQAGSPSNTAIPWLLLRAQPIVDQGVFGKVRYVLRLHTVGGIAPSAECDVSRAGQIKRVPYAADYYFYAPEPAGAK